jgi:hypothetical protein
MRINKPIISRSQKKQLIITQTNWLCLITSLKWSKDRRRYIKGANWKELSWLPRQIEKKYK